MIIANFLIFPSQQINKLCCDFNKRIYVSVKHNKTIDILLKNKQFFHTHTHMHIRIVFC